MFFLGEVFLCCNSMEIVGIIRPEGLFSKSHEVLLVFCSKLHGSFSLIDTSPLEMYCNDALVDHLEKNLVLCHIQKTCNLIAYQFGFHYLVITDVSKLILMFLNISRKDLSLPGLLLSLAKFPSSTERIISWDARSQKMRNKQNCPGITSEVN